MLAVCQARESPEMIWIRHTAMTLRPRTTTTSIRLFLTSMVPHPTLVAGCIQFALSSSSAARNPSRKPQRSPVVIVRPWSVQRTRGKREGSLGSPDQILRCST